MDERVIVQEGLFRMDEVPRVVGLCVLIGGGISGLMAGIFEFIVVSGEFSVDAIV